MCFFFIEYARELRISPEEGKFKTSFLLAKKEEEVDRCAS
jgi:hypothetical protein